MSITVTYSTLDHRYFMRRTKREIIDRIEELQGHQFNFTDRLSMVNKTKDELASHAMRLVRQMPPPPDPVDELVKVIQAECHRQFDDNTESDGTWILMNTRQLAQAILKSGVLPL